MSDLKHVELYTDGACSGNPGPGGYGAILIHGAKRREISQGYTLTTNNRMELRAVIAGLELLRYPCQVDVFSDSKYVVDAIEKRWAVSWRAKGWRRSTGEKALNADLWAQLLDILAKHKVKFHWVRGHAGHAENERCDELAVAATANPHRIPDEGFSPDKK